MAQELRFTDSVVACLHACMQELTTQLSLLLTQVDQDHAQHDNLMRAAHSRITLLEDRLSGAMGRFYSQRVQVHSTTSRPGSRVSVCLVCRGGGSRDCVVVSHTTMWLYIVPNTSMVKGGSGSSVQG